MTGVIVLILYVFCLGYMAYALLAPEKF